VKDPATGEIKGATAALGASLARKLGVPVEYLLLASSGDIVKSAESGAWDVTFVPTDEERKKLLDFGSAYHLSQSTYLVAPGSKIASVAEANAEGVRIGGIDNTATLRASRQASAKAAHATMPSVEAAAEQLRAGGLDAIALSREALTGLAAKLPGSRVLDGGFLNATTAVAVPRGRPAALAFVTAYIEEAKASGDVRRALDGVGLTASVVAPAGMKP
jgi:polar amino acid transport system substrate-binding protein